MSRRVLVLGATGMLGHVVWRECRDRFDAHATARTEYLGEVPARIFDPERLVTGFRAEEPGLLEAVLDRVEPEVVVNCIGVVKQDAAAADPVATILANALFPHQLAAACSARRARLIHVSTDCVFSGCKGGYREDDTPDPVDLYGRSKLLGEPSGSGILTLRTSMIGRELGRRNGLLEWFLSQDGEVRGFTRARFTGPTAPVLARAICDVIQHHPQLEGLWHVGAEPISKYDLLVLLRDAFGHEIEIVPDSEVVIDRTLNSSRFRAATGWAPPGWPEMTAELARHTHAGPESRHVLADR
jgi:dTDP-4-dehydrorhamnose reductase